MNIQTITECTQLSLAEQITFPEVVERLMGAGVERYIADLVGKKKFSYGVKGESFIGELAFEGPEIPASMNAEKVAAAIKNIQQGRIKYREFLARIMRAGCSHYEVFITGRKAIYVGRDGSQHIELFPDAP